MLPALRGVLSDGTADRFHCDPGTAFHRYVWYKSVSFWPVDLLILQLSLTFASMARLFTLLFIAFCAAINAQANPIGSETVSKIHGHKFNVPNAPIQNGNLVSRAACSANQGCNGCVNANNGGCGFNKRTFVCENRGGTEQVQRMEGCPQMNQQQGVRSIDLKAPQFSFTDKFQFFSQIFPAIKNTKRAGVPYQTVKDEWNRIMHHVFDGETSSRTSGRHLRSTWHTANPNSAVQLADGNTHLIKYHVRAQNCFSCRL